MALQKTEKFNVIFHNSRMVAYALTFVEAFVIVNVNKINFVINITNSSTIHGKN